MGHVYGMRVPEHLSGVLTPLSPVADEVAEAGPAVASALGGQGGGRPGLFQGKASALGGSSVAAATELLRHEHAGHHRAGNGKLPASCCGS